MKTLTLKNKFQTNATLVANDFIDKYMVEANGEFVKVYLFLLRHLNDPCSVLTISSIADCLNNTENDILRAFKYWEKEGLLSLTKDSDHRIVGIELEKNPFIKTVVPNAAEEQVFSCSGSESVAPLTAAGQPAVVSSLYNPDSGLTAPADSTVAPAPAFSTKSTATAKAAAKPVSKAIPLDSFKSQKEMKALLFVAEQYLGKTLTKTDIDTITYFYDGLGLNSDVIEYLIEYCVEHGHKSIHYIQKVALAWADAHVTTVEQAKAQSASYNKSCYAVMNTFGIKNRGPAPAEVSFINRWTDELGFTLDIIEEACSRTIAVTHQPSFEYTDRILTKWADSNVQHLKDIEALDAAYQNRKKTKKTTAGKNTASFNNFESRSYDIDSLEEQLLKSN
ncbi:MAG: DnaD domain protein [Hespellia sp.]|nr:DnaD domain protein [Hespellia sp.]